MKIKFKDQSYQIDAVNSVVDCFAGQPKISPLSSHIGISPSKQISVTDFEERFKNSNITLSEEELLDNIRKVQHRQNLPLSNSLTDFSSVNEKGKNRPVRPDYKRDVLAASQIHLDIEMETGTGKTYCYIKTIFEMNKRYGWSKFIVIVPSIAIREGIYKSFEITAEHFALRYGNKARFFIYNSKRLHELDDFSRDAGINVMIINIQAFNSRGKDNRRIYEELDDFQSRKPIEAIASNTPILILDEPQKMEGKATTQALSKFNPLFILRYSATHRIRHNRIHRLDALDAYNQKLVKKIAVRGIQARGNSGADSYLYLEGIDTSKNAPVARIELEVKFKSGKIKRKLLKLQFGDDLFSKSGKLDQYREFTISQIDAICNTVEFTNGVLLKAGDARGDVSEHDIRRIQIRETIKSHLEKESQLFPKKIKVLSLFFIDEVAKYRNYNEADQKGEYARVFEDEYALLKEEYLSRSEIGGDEYKEYLSGIDAAKTHNGYFSIDKKTRRLQNPAIKANSNDSDDVDAYGLILKDKEQLLSFDEPTRFIFSHSALREGWDNPNIFVMCILKHSDNIISRRQEVGRGLRLSVDQNGERFDHPSLVHDINILTVVASESYSDFVAGLQKEIAETLSSRPRQATEEYFVGKTIKTDEGLFEIDRAMAKQIYRYLIKNDYTDDMDHITDAYHEAKATGTLAELPKNLKIHGEQVFGLVDSVYNDGQLPECDNGRLSKSNPLNTNFHKKEFQELWAKINRKAIYRVEFDSDELIQKCVSALNSHLRITPLQYIIQEGEQKDNLVDKFHGNVNFKQTQTKTKYGTPVQSRVKYDLIGKISENTILTRKTSAAILQKIRPEVFVQFKQNPEHFITELSRIITEQKASIVIERLTYNEIDGQYGVQIFTAGQIGQDFSRATEKLRKHIYDYVITDSKVERNFVHDLDTSREIVVYAKLPRGFMIPTPVGDYRPDWAISFKAGSVKQIYFVAETKGTMSSMELRKTEEIKIDCARKFFQEIVQNVNEDHVNYDVVPDYAKLMDIVGASSTQTEIMMR